MLNASATVSCCSATEPSGAQALSKNFDHGRGCQTDVWRRSSLRSPEALQRGPIRALLAKEMREIAGGRALWIMLLLLCGLVGFSFLQAAELYGEATSSAKDSPLLAGSLSPLDGILVPTLGGFYLGVTLLFPFVAIRVISNEKETGALRLLVQLPYKSSTLCATKLAAVLLAWL